MASPQRDSTQASPRPRILLDCDPGHDDAAALAVAAHFGDLVGITTVGGNAPLADVTRNALLSAQVFGLDVEVYAGCDRPMVAEPLHAPEIHGVSGFSGPELPELSRSASSVGAIEYLIETIRAEEGLWLIPTGPLTNVAVMLRQAPDLVRRLAGISFMGGSAGNGNRTPTAEFNAMVDPEALKVVVDCGARVLMAGLDLTHQFVVDDSMVADLRAVQTPGAKMLGDLIDSYLDKAEQRGVPRRGGMHDPCAVLAVTHPELIQHTRRHVDVELNGQLTRGMTIVDQRPGAPAGGNVDHGHTIDNHTARGLFLEAVAALPGDYT